MLDRNAEIEIVPELFGGYYAIWKDVRVAQGIVLRAGPLPMTDCSFERTFCTCHVSPIIRTLQIELSTVSPD